MNIYKKALIAQNACNLSGLVKEWADMLDIIWDEAKRLGLGTDYVNTHPVNILMADKVLSLTGAYGSLKEYGNAYAICERLGNIPE
jgi:hypothetical protein